MKLLYKTTAIQSIIQKGIDKHGEKFINYLENFPKFSIIPLQEYSIDFSNLQYYEDTFGNLELRKKIALKESIKYNYNITYKDIILTNGATHALFLTILNLKKKGFDKVLIPAPSYSGYKDICEVLEMQYLPYNISSGFVDDIFTNISIDKSTILIINSPHNPTGSCLTKNNLNNLFSILSKKKCVIVCDCIYDQLIFNKKMIIDWTNILTNKTFKHIYFINSFSKNYGLPGLRLGWINSHKQNINEIEPNLERNVISLNNVSQNIAQNILSLDSDIFKQELLERRDYLCKKLLKIKKISFSKPDAGTTILVYQKGFDVNKMVAYLINKGIGILPGDAYYMGNPDCFRLSFGYDYEEINHFVSEIENYLSSH